MGMLIFKEAGVDYVVLETGLGGRLDATTSIENPMACVITSISMDHMEYLGNTLEEIAGEKAGIIVPGVPVIFDGNHQAAQVIRDRAKELGSPCYEICEKDCKVLENTREGIAFSMEEESFPDSICGPLSGDECGAGSEDHGSAEKEFYLYHGRFETWNCPNALAGKDGDGSARCDCGRSTQ